MTTWRIRYLPEAKEDLASLDGSQRVRVQKALRKVAENPLPSDEGGYGKPLGHKRTYNLSGLLKVKLKADGIRIVYKLEKVGEEMIIVVIGMRAEDEVYGLAAKRRDKHDL